ncbi:Acetylornithine aminotransferase [Patulibacter medicamentivorans]|uniref:Acetylornithine aminotransferase n=1 Tax=Patulibacter medicamentivorans TaxID=1097667 RepID=H0E7L8_9ACTN|nr:aminotransferase class III-fold pyridoxal phosphate-dependent enzyme [Patulibacter medicamentivorans]EHN10292.1 Acetylornithine aminotransferase [Patulibacter medicamentivorans]
MTDPLTLEQLEAIERDHVLPTYARMPVAVTSGADVWLHTADGRRVLDLLCGLGVTSLGHAHPAVTMAIVEQAGRLLHTSNLMHLEGPVTLARRLSRSSLGGGVFFTNSGAEANEAAIKLARRHKRGGEVISLHRGFHGRTYGALSATPQEAKQEPFAPLVAGFRAVPATAEAVAGAVDDGTAAVLLETIQGESGVLPIGHDVLAAAREACDAHGALLIVDEIQTGVGRSGTLWSYEASGIVPDAITVAKALANGLPIGALITGPHLYDTFRPGDHGSTFAGGPVAAAAAHAVLDVVTGEGFLARVGEAGERFAAGLRALPGVADVRGRGLMLAVELDADAVARHGSTAELAVRLITDHDVWVNAPSPTALRLLPPLTIRDEQIDEGVARIGAGLAAR